MRLLEALRIACLYRRPYSALDPVSSALLVWATLVWAIPCPPVPARSWFATPKADELEQALKHRRWLNELGHPPSRAESERWQQDRIRDLEDGGTGTGLWIRPSLFNHRYEYVKM